MKKRRIIFALIGVFVLIGLWVVFKGRILSPSETVSVESKGLTMSVNYSRPSVRDRLIFGTLENDALQPYGEYWRLGANESTEISIDKDIILNGQYLKAGRYKIYAIPGEADFEFGINTETGTWGAQEPDYTKDLVRFKIPVEYKQQITEQHTISLLPSKSGIEMNIDFEHVHLVIPFYLAE